MPLTKIHFRPGIERESTQYTTGQGWYDCDKIRFRKGRPEQIGGWVKPNISVIFPAAANRGANPAEGVETTSFRGIARSLLDWGTASAKRYLSLGTNLKFYVEIGGSMSDITPFRSESNSVLFTAINGSSILEVADASHGCAVGDYVIFSAATGLGGNITADVLNHEYVILALDDVDPNNVYTITAKDVYEVTVTANVSDTSDGGSTLADYQITTGTNFFVPATGWNVGTYGNNVWGGGGNLTLANQLRLYSQDVFGDDLIFNPRAGGVYYWDESAGTGDRAVNLSALSGATDTPTVCLQVMVSPIDRHVICFGVNDLNSSDLDPLLVRWSDQEEAAIWTPTVENSAGGTKLSSGTSIVGAIRTRQEILIFTDTSMHSMRFAGAPFIFQFSPIAENVTILSPKAAISVGDAVFFMDMEGFYVYRGSVERIPCMVHDYVFSGINKEQVHKTYGANNPDDSEVTWFYQDNVSGTVDVNRYVTYNYSDNLWTIGSMDRGSWIQAPTRVYPHATTNDTVNELTNYLFEHENGNNADGSAMLPYIESGDIELGDGDRLVFLKRFIPDFKWAGVKNNVEFTIRIQGRDFPMEDLTTRSTSTVYATTKQKHLRVRAREITMRIDGLGTGYGWSMGDFRFEMRSDGRR